MVHTRANSNQFKWEKLPWSCFKILLLMPVGCKATIIFSHIHFVWCDGVRVANFDIEFQWQGQIGSPPWSTLFDVFEYQATQLWMTFHNICHILLCREYGWAAVQAIECLKYLQDVPSPAVTKLASKSIWQTNQVEKRCLLSACHRYLLSYFFTIKADPSCYVSMSSRETVQEAKFLTNFGDGLIPIPVTY